MKIDAIKPLFTALLLAGSCAAHAAHFEVLGYQPVFAGYSWDATGESGSHEGNDLSQDGDIALFGVAAFESTGYAHGYATDTFYEAATGYFRLSATQYLDADAGMAFSGSSLVSLPALSLRIVGDGEAAGSTVQVSFSGLNSAFGSSTAYTDVTFAMLAADGSTLGSFLADSLGDRSAGLSFTAKVGDQVQLSAFMNTQLAADGSQAVSLANVANSLDGNFTIAAVPEPEQYALFLAGLGLLGLARRRGRA